MDDFCGKVQRMEGPWMCFVSFFFLWYLHPHSHIINTHTHPGSQSWTVKHEMNMSSVNFDWHFHAAPGYMGHYTYQNELLTIKNAPNAKLGSPVRRVNKPIYQSQHNPSQSIYYYTNTNRITQWCMHTVTQTHIEKYDLKAQWCTHTAAAQFTVDHWEAPLRVDWLAFKKHQIAHSSSEQKECDCSHCWEKLLC